MRVTTDGRNIAPELGSLVGEAAPIRVKAPDEAFPLPDELRAERSQGTYYGMPMLKKPVWKGWIPAYFWTGGAAGAAATLGAAAQIVAPSRLRHLVVRTRWLSTVLVGASAMLLTIDLGRPMRFLNMLRVLRVSSPMSVGTWILTASGVTSALAALGSDRAGLAAGVLGLPLSGYTAVLLTNTAVPAWLHASRAMPALFVASGAASASALLELLPCSARESRVVRAFSVAGKLGEVVGMRGVSRALDAHPSVAKSLRSGRAGGLWRMARVLSLAGLAATLLGKGRGGCLAAGLLGTAGALALRFAIVEAGKQSALAPSGRWH
jgi:formate-dependent nitrite reductase membrane component NrfD